MGGGNEVDEFTFIGLGVVPDEVKGCKFLNCPVLGQRMLFADADEVFGNDFTTLYPHIIAFGFLPLFFKVPGIVTFTESPTFILPPSSLLYIQSNENVTSFPSGSFA
jgi:hypothetical protein